MTNLEIETIEGRLVPAGEPPMAAMLQLLLGKHITYALSAVARFGVADHLGSTPVPVEEVAQSVGAHAGSLYRVMRMLASVGVFEETPGKQFNLTPVGEVLRTDARESLRYLAMAWGDEWSTRAFENFLHCVRTGQDGVTKAYGKNAFELLAEHPDQADTFHKAMMNVSAIAGAAMAETYDFAGISSIADIGGGHGMLLASVLKGNPGIRGVLYDLPEVVAGAKANGHFAGLEDRLQIDAGSFFERVPAGCDTYMLKHILHDWSDDHCRTILNLIREQLPANGRVLVCELIVPDGPGASPAKMLDIEMLALTVGGKERTTGEFSELFLSAGLQLERVVPTKSPIVVLEARACPR
jgi:hypothetical protein